VKGEALKNLKEELLKNGYSAEAIKEIAKWYT